MKTRMSMGQVSAQRTGYAPSWQRGHGESQSTRRGCSSAEQKCYSCAAQVGTGQLSCPVSGFRFRLS